MTLSRSSGKDPGGPVISAGRWRPRAVILGVIAAVSCVVIGYQGVPFALTAWRNSIGTSWHQENTKDAIPADSDSADDLAPSPLTAVHALGRLEPKGTILKIAPPSGNEGARVQRLLVTEGQTVSAGDLLAELDNQARRSASLDEAKAQLQLARLRLDQVQAGAKPAEIAAQHESVSSSREQVLVAQRDLERARQLQTRNAMTDEELQKFQWALDRSQFDLRRAEQLLAGIQEVRTTDVAVAQQGIVVAETGVEKAAAELEACRVLAPVAGTILKIHTRPGERITDNALLEMGDVGRMQAVAEVFESDVAVLRVGMPAKVMLEFGTPELSGQVEEIGRLVARKSVLSNDPVSDTDARVVEVRVALDPESARTVAGLSNARVEVTIQLNESASLTRSNRPQL